MEAQTATIRTHYDILGLTPDCSIEEVKTAHLQLTMLLQHQHVLQPLHQQQLQAYLDESYQILSDADWRTGNRRSIIGLMNQNEALEIENARLEKELWQLQQRLEACELARQQLQERIRELENQLRELRSTSIKISDLRNQLEELGGMVTLDDIEKLKVPRAVTGQGGLYYTLHKLSILEDRKTLTKPDNQSYRGSKIKFNFWVFCLILILLFWTIDQCS